MNSYSTKFIESELNPIFLELKINFKLVFLFLEPRLYSILKTIRVLLISSLLGF